MVFNEQEKVLDRETYAINFCSFNFQMSLKDKVKIKY